jgi:two-component system, OmpR family, phosphate regulon sensor histidine kinase PhoR
VILVLVIAVVMLGIALLVTVVIARSSARKLAAGAADVPFFRAAAAENARTRSSLETAIAALKRQHALDLEILDGLSEGVLAVDRDRRIVVANRRSAELFDGTGSVVGRPFREVARVTAVFDAFDRAFAGDEVVERFSIRAGVAERKIEMRARPLASDAIAAVAVFIDVTQLERLEVIRRNFISDFSHEVRTPLAGLRCAVETYEGMEHLTATEQEQLRRVMSRQLLRLERLVDDLSELSRIESGDLLLDRHRIDLRRLVDDLCEDFAERAAQHRVRILVTGEPVFINADPLRIQQALSNLIDNAMKYGGEGKEILIDVAAAGGAAEVRITDRGIGIPDGEKEKIFRRFYRIDKSRSQETAGTGLGLAIAKHLILQHHGTIDVESQPGRGATFIVRLPKAQ